MASNADIRRLVLNDDRLSTLILTLDHTLNIPQLQYALSLNGTVREIVVYTDETFLPRFSVADVRGLFDVLGAIPSLERLCFNSRSGFDGVLSVQSLIFVLNRATRLTSFAVSDLKLEGTHQDWSQFAEQLQRAVYLHSFCIIECELSRPAPGAAANDADDGGAAVAIAAIVAASNAAANPSNNNANSSQQKCPLDPMVMVLSILPSMEKVYLHSTRSGGLGSISSQAVGALLLSASLKVLKIRDFQMGADTVRAMARMLQVNPVLKELKVGTMSDFHDTKNDSSSGNNNNSSSSSSRSAVAAFATMLEHNTSLECLEMGLSSMISDECAAILAKSLKANKGLKSFALTAEDNDNNNNNNGMMMTRTVSKPCKESFVDMLRSNYIIENFVLFQRFPVKPEFKLFVTLNKLGRGKLLQQNGTTNNNMHQWMHALATVNDDLDALFYYVSINPDLCHFALQRRKEKETLAALACAGDSASTSASTSTTARPNKKQKMTPGTTQEANNTPATPLLLMY